METETGEVSRARVQPAGRAGVRKFLVRFRGEELEVALEATTGRRLVVEELGRIEAVVQLAETAGLRAKPFVTPMRSGRLPPVSCRHARVAGLERPSGRNASRSGVTPSTITAPARSTESWNETRLGARAHATRTVDRAHAPPLNQELETSTQDHALERGFLHRQGDGGE